MFGGRIRFHEFTLQCKAEADKAKFIPDPPKLFVFGGAWWLFSCVPPPRKIPNRQRALAQWRGVDLTPLEVARATPARRAGDLMPQLLKELKLDAKQGEAEIVKVWNSMLDPVVTAHAQPANLHKGTLYVNVDNSVWLSEIVRYRRKEILDRLQFSFGKELIKKISFRIG